MQVSPRRMRPLGLPRRFLVALVAALTCATAAVVGAPPAGAAVQNGPNFTVNAGTTAAVYTTTGGSAPVVSGHTGPNTPAAEVSTITLGASHTYIVLNGLHLGPEDTLNLVFSSATDIVFLNAIGGSTAQIAGQVNAYLGSVNGLRGGNVWLGGISGLTFASTARVDVGGMLATSHRTSADEFLAGTYQFYDPFIGVPPVIIGSGALVTGHGSVLAFLGPFVQQSAGSVVSGDAAAGTEVLYGGADSATLSLAGHASGLEVLGYTPTATFMDGGTGPNLFGTTSAADVFVAGAATSFQRILLQGSIEAIGAPASDRGDVVVAAGGRLTRASGSDPMQPVGTTSYFLTAAGTIDAARRVLLSTPSSISLESTARLSAPSVVLSAADSVVNRAGAAAVDVGPTGQWVVYAGGPLSVQPPTGVSSTLDSERPAVWGTTLAGTPPTSLTGNRYVFRQLPTVTVTAVDAVKPFGTVFTGFDFVTTGPHLGAVGLYRADLAAAYTGTPAFASAGAAADARVLRTGPYPITVGQGTLTSPPGYPFRFVEGRLTVTDATAAVVEAVVTGSLGSNDWYTDDVTVDWSVEDDESYTDPEDCPDVTVTDDQQATMYTCAVTGPGGDATGTVTIARDATPPSLVVTGLAGGTTEYLSGTWTNQDVGVFYQCSDETSGVDAGTLTVNRPLPNPTGDYPGTCSDLAGNTTTVPFRVNVDRTAPVISDVAARAGGLAYAEGTPTAQDVTVTWTCTDTGGSGVVAEGGSRTLTESGDVTPTCADTAGNSASGTPFAVVIDTGDPTVLEPTLSSADGPYVPGSWARGPVTLTWGCEDGGSGPALMGGSEVAEASGMLIATCTDNAGNEVTESFDVSIDRDAPTVENLSITSGGQPYTSGDWTDGDVVLTWTCADTGGSGAVAPESPRTVTASETVRAFCSDAAGNGATSDAFVVAIDRTAPLLAGMPADLSVATDGDTAAVTWAGPTATDDLDDAPEIACTPPSGSAFDVGTTTVTCTATDHAGNVDTDTFTVTVTRETTEPPTAAVSFTAPFDGLPVMNLIQPGRTAPVRVALTLDDVPVTGTAPGPLYVGAPVRVPCTVTRTTDWVESYSGVTAPSSNLFRWDRRFERWTYQLNSSRLRLWVNSCYEIPVHYGGTVVRGIASGGEQIGSFYVRPRR